MSESMEGRVALVTGGLTGIGKGAVLELARRKCTIVIFGRKGDKAEAVIEEVRKLGGEAVFKKCDLFDEKQIEEGFRYILDTFGHLDYAFNNAAFGLPAKRLDEVTTEEVDTILSICLRAQILCMTHELKIMKDAGVGRIVNTTSGAGLQGASFNALYSAAKHGIVGITKSAALEYVKDNITVNAVAPGTVETELVASLKDISPETYEMCCKSNPMGRMAQPGEIGRVVSFLFEDDSAFINGVVIPVDSGYCAGK